MDATAAVVPIAPPVLVDTSAFPRLGLADMAHGALPASPAHQAAASSSTRRTAALIPFPL